MDKHFSNPSFRTAAQDFFYLLNSGYAENPALKLVGDRHRLSGVERRILYRGIKPRLLADKRRNRIHTEPVEGPLGLDGYNIIFPLMNYFLGRPLFVSNDGFLRDPGEAFGKDPAEGVFERSLELLKEYIKSLKRADVRIYWDESLPLHPPSEFWDQISERVPNADQDLIQNSPPVLATSDGEIIDATSSTILDIPKLILEKRFHTSFFQLTTLLK